MLVSLIERNKIQVLLVKSEEKNEIFALKRACEDRLKRCQSAVVNNSVAVSVGDLSASAPDASEATDVLRKDIPILQELIAYLNRQ